MLLDQGQDDCGDSAGCPPDTGSPCPTDSGSPSSTDSGSPSSRDSDEPGDTGSGDDPWNQEGYWEDPTDLEPIFDLDAIPEGTPHWELRMNVSTGGWASDPGYTTIGYGFSSLDLFNRGDALILMGQVDFSMIYLDKSALEPDGKGGVQPISRGGSPGGGDTGGKEKPTWVYAVTTPDLENFGGHAWEVLETDTRWLIDTAIESLSDGGMRLIYYAMTGIEDISEVEPSQVEGDHYIYSAYRDGETFVQWPDPLYWDEGLVDPTICEFQGQHYFFSTKDTWITAATSTDGDTFVFDKALEWYGNQVPYCLEYEDELWVVAQVGGGFGAPAYKRLQDDGTLSELHMLYENDEMMGGACTSPVMTVFNDRYVLFCAVWVE